MSLMKESWIDEAKKLQLGQRRRVDHDCGPGHTMIVSHKDEGYSAHCFRCNEDGFQAHGLRRIDQLFTKHAERIFQGKVELPKDFTYDIPAFAACWLYKAGLFKETAEAYGIGWSEALQRVILPVYEGVELRFLQARAVHSWQKPKYLNPPCPKGLLFHARSRIEQPITTDRICIVTEDILSCIRVGVQVPAVSTLGTSVSDEQALYLSGFDRCVFWYDSDAAGVKGRTAGVRKLNMLGVQASFICTPKDPKCYSNREIKEFIHGHVCRS